MLQEDELLYDHLQETLKLRKKLASIENEKQNLHQEEILNSINVKAVKLLKLLNLCIERFERINNKKAATMLNMKMKLGAKTEDQCLQFSHTLHDDFENMLLNKEKLENLMDSLVQHPKDNDCFDDILKEFQKLNSMWCKQIAEEIIGGKASKAFLENINYLKQLEQEKNCEDEQKNDSDLGSYPHDSNLGNIDAPCMSQFATSSPIPKNHNEDKLLKTPT